MIFAALPPPDIPTSFHMYEQRAGKRDQIDTSLPVFPVKRTYEPTPISAQTHESDGESNVEITQFYAYAPAAAEIDSLDEVVRHIEVNDAILRAQETRAILLARKYDGKASIEDNARLEMLNARLERLSPQVTETDFQALENFASLLEEASNKLDNYTKLFDL